MKSQKLLRIRKDITSHIRTIAEMGFITSGQQGTVVFLNRFGVKPIY